MVAHSYLSIGSSCATQSCRGQHGTTVVCHSKVQCGTVQRNAVDTATYACVFGFMHHFVFVFAYGMRLRRAEVPGVHTLPQHNGVLQRTNDTTFPLAVTSCIIIARLGNVFGYVDSISIVIAPRPIARIKRGYGLEEAFLSRGSILFSGNGLGRLLRFFFVSLSSCGMLEEQ